MNNFFSMQKPPQGAQEALRDALLVQQRKMGRITQAGLPQTLVGELEEIDPSALRLMSYLYENAEVTIDLDGAKACGSPNTTQMKIDIRWLIDQHLATAVIHDGKQYVFLTPRGEDIMDDR